MNRDEIINMQPGRELDKLIMQTVFNASKNYYGEEELWFHYDENGEPDYEWSCYYSPSTGISAAWEVVEELQGSHLYTDIRTCADFYEVWITNHANGQQTETFAAPKLPEAICKAALLSLIQEDTPQ